MVHPTVRVLFRQNCRNGPRRFRLILFPNGSGAVTLFSGLVSVIYCVAIASLAMAARSLTVLAPCKMNRLPLALFLGTDGAGTGLLAWLDYLCADRCKVGPGQRQCSPAGGEMQGGVTTLPATIHDYRHRPFVSVQSPAVARSAATPRTRGEQPRLIGGSGLKNAGNLHIDSVAKSLSVAEQLRLGDGFRFWLSRVFEGREEIGLFPHPRLSEEEVFLRIEV